MDTAPSKPFYGWTVLGALAIAQIAAWGVLYYGFAVFLLPMERELGWSRAQLSGAFSIGLLTSAAAAVPIGRYIDRHGARGPLLAGSCAALPLLVAWAYVDTLWAFYAIWIALGLTMSAVLYEPAFAVIVAWFDRRRATALAILTSLAGFSSTIFVPLITVLIERQGWRRALLTLTVALAFILLPIYAWIIRSRPSDLGLHPDGVATAAAPARSTTATAIAPPAGTGVWTLSLIFGISTFGGAAAVVHALPFLIGQGMKTTAAAAVMALLGAAQVPGRVAFGALGRGLPTRWLTPAVFLLQALGLASLALVRTSPAFIIAFAVLLGAGNGLTTLVRPLLVAERFGIAQYGAVSGRIAACGQIARAAGPFAAAWAFGLFGSYEPVWWWLAVATAGSAVMLVIADRATAARPSSSEELLAR